MALSCKLLIDSIGDAHQAVLMFVCLLFVCAVRVYTYVRSISVTIPFKVITIVNVISRKAPCVLACWGEKKSAVFCRTNTYKDSVTYKYCTKECRFESCDQYRKSKTILPHEAKEIMEEITQNCQSLVKQMLFNFLKCTCQMFSIFKC